MALQLIAKHGSHFPFAMIVTPGGKRANIAADDTEVRDREILFATVREELSKTIRQGGVRAFALAQVDQFAYVVGRDGDRMGGGRVAGGSEHCLDEWRLECRPRERVLSSAGTDDQYSPTHPRTPSNDNLVARLPMSMG